MAKSLQSPTPQLTPREKELSGFSQRVRAGLDASSLSMSEVAHRCNVTPQAISNIVNPSANRTVQGCRFADKLARALGLPVEWLLYGDAEQRGSTPVPLVPRKHELEFTGLNLAGLTPLQSGAMHSLSELMRQGKLSDADLSALLHQAHLASTSRNA